MIIIKWFAPIVIAVLLIYSIIWLIFDIKDSIDVAKAFNGDVSIWTLLDMRTKVVIVILFLTLFIFSVLMWV